MKFEEDVWHVNIFVAKARALPNAAAVAILPKHTNRHANTFCSSKSYSWMAAHASLCEHG